MTNYRRRLERDLDDWIGRGLVPEASRQAILEEVSEGRRLDAATALAVAGGLLAGVAAIAFVAANWPQIPRLVRFAAILAAFLGAAGGAAFAVARGRAIAGQVFLAIAALVFSAAIGLTGQIFDIAGDPRAALRGAGLGALLLALAGRSPWTAAVGLAFLLMGDFAGTRLQRGAPVWIGWSLIAAPLAAVLAVRLRSQALAQAAGAACLLAPLAIQVAGRGSQGWVFMGAAVLLAAGAGLARHVGAAVLYGWLTFAALIWFGAGGMDEPLNGIAHHLVWMLLALAVLAVGRHDRRPSVTAAGVLGLFVSGAFLLSSLGVDLMTTAAVFGACALAAFAAAVILKRRRSA